MNTYTIRSFNELIKYFEFFNENSMYVFRGQSDSEWELLPKVGRKEFKRGKGEGQSDINLFYAWKRYAIKYVTLKPSNDWEWYSLAQHHGLATRLLDWSKNPLVATFFAINSNLDKDSAVYTFKIERFVNEYECDSPFNVKNLAIYYPHGVSSRIILQRGVFSISDKPELALEETLKDRLYQIIIPKDLKSEIKKQLDFYNINDFSIFQDLDSLSNYLNNYTIETINLMNVNPPVG